MEADSIRWQHGKESDAGVGRKKVTLTCEPAASVSEREKGKARRALGQRLGSARDAKQGEGRVGRARGEK
jgi:hypothetical protein